MLRLKAFANIASTIQGTVSNNLSDDSNEHVNVSQFKQNSNGVKNHINDQYQITNKSQHSTPSKTYQQQLGQTRKQTAKTFTSDVKNYSIPGFHIVDFANCNTWHSKGQIVMAVYRQSELKVIPS